MDKILGGTPATKPALVIDNNTETVNINDDHETQKVCNDSVEDDLESVAGTDTSTSSEGSSKAAVPKDNKPNKHSREDQLQSIMSGIVT